MSEMCSMHLNKLTAMILDFIVYLSQQKDIEKIVDELENVDRAVFHELVVNAMEKNPSHTSIIVLSSYGTLLHLHLQLSLIGLMISTNFMLNFS